VRKSVKKN